MKDIALYLAYVPVVAALVAFVVGGGILLPLWEYLDARKDRVRTRHPDRLDADVIGLPRRNEDAAGEKVAA